MLKNCAVIGSIGLVSILAIDVCFWYMVEIATWLSSR
jgi:hypothetical protein